jgi:hypothetical protein
VDDAVHIRRASIAYDFSRWSFGLRRNNARHGACRKRETL